MKRSLVFLSILLLPLMSMAEVDNILIVETNDGVTISFALAEKPEISFEGKVMSVLTEKDSQYFEISKISKWYFEQVTSGIQTIKKEQPSIKVVDNDNIIVDSSSSLSKIRLYSIDGKEQSLKVSYSDDKKPVINLSGLPKGIYVISINKQQSIKLYRK